ncbi:MAG TPA: FecR domain-containing protein, partial [Mucilaginibacter sp.]
DLNNAIQGVIAQQANTSIHKNAGGRLIYTAAAGESPVDANGLIPKNIITTPNGGQYEVVLPDGTHVTLNAASSLTYPVAFTGHERTVTLTGEAYFEVAHNKAMPFKVNSGVQTVTVLGTHFNVNAYPDEVAMKTTLLQGSVQVAVNGKEELIVPGQQMVVQPQSGSLSKLTVNTDKEIAWKNGVFSFDGDDLKSIMRQVSRWYDVEVTYNGSFPDEKFFGEISRNSSLANVLKIMELNNVHFDISGRRIKVSYSASKTQN